MKSYLDANGIYHRTQAEAKATGLPFELFDIPTDHAGLIFFINQLHSGFPVPVREDPTSEPDQSDEIIPNGNTEGYHNGCPTTPYMGSRDPRAIFTCRHCGRSNAPEKP